MALRWVKNENKARARPDQFMKRGELKDKREVSECASAAQRAPSGKNAIGKTERVLCVVLCMCVHACSACAQLALGLYANKPLLG